MKIYFDEPVLDISNAFAVGKAIRSHQISTAAYATIRKFEKACAEYLGVDDCIATNSGTSALHLAYIASGVKRVTMPVLSFVATANAAKYAGVEIEFCDVDEDTWCGNITGIIKSDGVVLIPLYGSATVKASFQTTESNLNMILDCAHIFGRIENLFTGTDKFYFCFSFNGNKTLTTGAGGLLVGPNLDQIREMIYPRTYDSLSYNYGMPGLNAALGLSQLPYIDTYNKQKSKFNQIYREELGDFLTFQKTDDFQCWMVAALWPQVPEVIDIEEIQIKLAYKDIPTRRIFKPMNQYRHLQDGKYYPVAEDIYRRGLVLPTSCRNTEKEIMYVCKVIKEIS